MNTRRCLPTCLCIAMLLSWTESNADSPLVTVAPIVEREVSSGASFVGNALPLRTSIVGSAVDGRVVDIPVKQGDRVKEGQLLARLNSETLEIELAGAKAEARVREQELKELEQGARPEEVREAAARSLAAEALMKHEQARARRMQLLFDKRNASEEELDVVVLSAAQSEHAHEQAKAALALVNAGVRIEKIEQARARLQVQKELVRKLESDIAKHRVTAPFAGYVVLKTHEVGEWLKQGDPVLQIAALDQLDIEVFVLEEYFGKLQSESPVRVQFGSLPDRPLIGHIASIVPMSNVRSRSFPIRVRVDNPIENQRPLLHAGMFARVSLPVGTVEKALLVPKDALVFGGPSPVIFVLDNESIAGSGAAVQPVAVELGVVSDNLIQVKGAVRAGQTVVVQGNERLQAGDVVRCVSPPTVPIPAKVKTTAKRNGVGD